MTASAKLRFVAYLIGVPLIGIVHYCIAFAVIMKALAEADSWPLPPPPTAFEQVLTAPLYYPFFDLMDYAHDYFGDKDLFILMFLNAVFWGFVLVTFLLGALWMVGYVNRKRGLAKLQSSS
jgi:tellurite resistance protein TehA-like permease